MKKSLIIVVLLLILGGTPLSLLGHMVLHVTPYVIIIGAIVIISLFSKWLVGFSAALDPTR